MSDLCFWSRDDRFGLVVPAKQLSRIVRWCERAGPEETGGILIGYFTKALDCAVVTEATGPPPDSQQGRTWFARGTGDLQDLLNGRWRRRRQHYLGEWHAHPGGTPEPSARDISQMKHIARAETCSRPEPVLLLIGGTGRERQARAHVFPRGRPHVRLIPQP